MPSIPALLLALAVLIGAPIRSGSTATLSSPVIAGGPSNYAVSMTFINTNAWAADITGFTAKSGTLSTAMLFEVWYYTSAVLTTGFSVSVAGGWTKVFTGTVTTSAAGIASFTMPSGSLLIPGGATYALAIYSTRFMPTPNSATVVDATAEGCILRTGIY